jgi:DNA-binding transcriptional MerR regulator
MQWLDERGPVTPRIEAHRRLYTREQALRVIAIAQLRRKGLTLRQAIRATSTMPPAGSGYLVTTVPVTTVWHERTAGDLMRRLSAVRKPIVTLDLASIDGVDLAGCSGEVRA